MVLNATHQVLFVLGTLLLAYLFTACGSDTAVTATPTALTGQGPARSTAAAGQVEPAPSPMTRQIAPTPTPTDRARPVRFLALGDSHTIGAGVPASARWPAQLVQRIRGEGFEGADVDIVARTGWTTDEMLGGIGRATLLPTYDLVTLLIGVNDQFRGNDSEGYRLDLRLALDKALGFAGDEPGRVIVVSIPDWGATLFGQGSGPVRIAEEIDEFNSVNKEEAESADVRYVDVTAISRQATKDAELVAGDGLHPSGKMYAAWTEVILPAALEILSGS